MTWRGVAFALAAAAGMLSPLCVHAQVEEVEEQEYLSIRIDVWSKRYQTVAEDGQGVRLKVALSTALLRYRTLDELLDPDTEHINALGVRPKLELEYPTRLQHISFVPDIELALNHSLDTSNNLLAGAAQAAWLYRHRGDNNDLKIKAGIKYGTRYEQDGLNFDDYLELNLRLDLKRISAFSVGQRRLTIVPFGRIKHFIDDLEFVTETDAVFAVDRQYELGFEFSTDPRKKIGRIALPKLKVSYVFGDDFKGIKIRL